MLIKNIKIQIILLIIFISNLNGQTLQVDYLNATINSTQYTFLGIRYEHEEITFKPDYELLKTALQKKQARYDAGLDLVLKEYNKAIRMELINKQNLNVLKEFKSNLENFKYKFAGWDFSLPQNVNSVLEYITQIYKNEGIRNEIIVLQKLNSKTKKYQNSIDFFTKKEILDVINRLSNCNVSEIINIENQIEKIGKSYQDFSNEETKKNKSNYWNSIRDIYNKFRFIPEKVPDGWHKVITKLSGNENLDELDEFSEFKEHESVYVKNNKIIQIADSVGDIYSGSIVEFPELINTNTRMTSTNFIETEYSIKKGIGRTDEDILYIENDGRRHLYSEDAFKEWEELFGEKSNHKIKINKSFYFIDYISKYNTAQLKIDELKHFFKPKNKKIVDGWQNAYATNEIDFCEIRSVLIKNGKIIKYKVPAGNEYAIETGGVILNDKSNISYIVTSKEGKEIKRLLNIYIQ